MVKDAEHIYHNQQCPVNTDTLDQAACQSNEMPLTPPWVGARDLESFPSPTAVLEVGSVDEQRQHTHHRRGRQARFRKQHTSALILTSSSFA